MIIDINTKMKNNMYNPYKALQLYSGEGSNYGPGSIKAIFAPTTAQSLKTIIGEINKVIGALGKLNKAIEDSANNTTENVDEVTQNTNANKRQIENNIKSVCTNMASIGSTAERIARPAENLAFTFESVMEEIQLKTGMSNSAINTLEGTILNLSTSTSESSSNIAECILDLYEQGIKGSQAISDIQQASELATVSGTSLGTALQEVVTAMTSYGETGKSNISIANTLYEVQMATGASLKTVGSAFESLAPVSKKLHISFSDIGSALMEMNKKGTTVSGNAKILGGVIEDLNQKGSKANNLLKKLGDGGLATAIKKCGSFKKVLDDMKGLTKDNNKQFAALFKTTGEGNAVMAILTGKTKNLNKQTGDLNKTFKNYNKSAVGQMKHTNIELQNSLIELGKAMIPIISSVTRILDKFNSLSPITKKLIGYGVLGLAAIGKVSVALLGILGIFDKIKKSKFGKFIGNVFKKIGAGVKELPGKIMKSLKSISKSIKGMFISIKSTMRKIAEKIVKTFGKITIKVISKVKALRGKIVSMAGAIRDKIVGISGTIFSKVKSIAGKITEVVGDASGKILNKVVSVAGTLRGKIVTVAGTVLNGIKSAAGSIAEVVGEVGGKVLGLITASVSGVKDVLIGLWGVMEANPIEATITIIGILCGAIYELWEHCAGFRNAVIGIFHDIEGAFMGVIDGIRNAWESFTGWFSNKIRWVTGVVDRIKSKFNFVVLPKQTVHGSLQVSHKYSYPSFAAIKDEKLGFADSVIGDTLINSVPIINYSNDFMSGFSFDMPEINSIDFEGGVIGKVMEAIDKISKRPIVTNVKMNGRNIVKATHKDFDNLNGEEAALNARMRGVLIG